MLVLYGLFVLHQKIDRKLLKNNQTYALLEITLKEVKFRPPI
jgi:hypothetical protein